MNSNILAIFIFLAIDYACRPFLVCVLMEVISILGWICTFSSIAVQFVGM